MPLGPDGDPATVQGDDRMASLQSFDSEIEKTRTIVNEVRGKMEQSSVVLDQFAKADTKLGDVNFDIENARIEDVIKQQKVMEANIADLIIRLEDATNVRCRVREA
jgi:hypothetical protein